MPCKLHNPAVLRCQFDILQVREVAWVMVPGGVVGLGLEWGPFRCPIFGRADVGKGGG